MKNVITALSGQAQLAVDDPWQLEPEFTSIPPMMSIIEAGRWGALNEEHRPRAVLIQNEADLTIIESNLNKIDLIAIHFKDFKDGRCYSLAYLLRTRMGYRGELRAIGDVLRDQLSLMLQCGFDSFAIKEGKDPNDALKGLKGGSVTYSATVKTPLPLFSRVIRK